MFGAIYTVNMKNLTSLVTLVLLTATLPLSGQFRAAKKSADKAFELHAYHLAIEGYQRALAGRDDDTETLVRLGDAFRMLNKPDSARLYYERAITDRKVDPQVLLRYGQTLKSLGEYELALPIFLNYAREVNAAVGNHFASSCDFAISQRNQDAGFTVATLPINSAAADFGPNLPFSGQFIFNSARLDEEFSGVATNRPYVSRTEAGDLMTEAVPVAFNYRAAAGSNGPVSYSPDGTQVVFSRNNFTAGTRMVPEAGITLTLLIADVNQAGEWTNVRPLPFNGNAFNSGFATFGPDGNSLYFASDRPGGYGGYDIYRARKEAIGWEATPENMGGQVNSRGHEITPFMDGNSLYFSSDWHQGLGNYDVFRAEIQDGNALLLYHMGGNINSSRDDFGFVYDAGRGTGYFVSNRGGDYSQEDIYRVKATDPVAGDFTSPEGIASGPEKSRPQGIPANTPVPFGTVRGYVTDIQTNQPVSEAVVRVTDRNTGRAIDARTDVEGAYYVSVKPSTVYDVNVVSEGYESMTFPVSTPTTRNEEAFGNIMLLPIQGGSMPVMTETAAMPPPTVPDSAPPEANSVTTGFSVQLASVVAKPDLSAYGRVAPLGKVYSRWEAGKYKVRLGPFATREEAAVASRQAKNMGYDGNFIVGNSGPESEESLSSDTSPKLNGQEVYPFRVQLGAFGKPENFDRELAATLGPLGSELRGALTIFYIGVETQASGNAVQGRAIAKGFTGAYLQKLVDGKFVKPN